MRVIDRIVAPLGRRIDELSPMVDARLADGSRVNTIIPPLAIDGPALTIRKFSPQAYELADLVRMGTLTERSGRVPQRVRAGPGQHPRERRHRQRQDHAAQRALVDDPGRPSGSSPSRTRPSCGSSSARGAAREPPANIEGKGEVRTARPGAERAAHASRPHHRRRGARRRSARHDAGDEHRPRRLAVDPARELAARRDLAHRDHGADVGDRPADAGDPRAAGVDHRAARAHQPPARRLAAHHADLRRRRHGRRRRDPQRHLRLRPQGRRRGERPVDRRAQGRPGIRPQFEDRLSDLGIDAPRPHVRPHRGRLPPRALPTHESRDRRSSRARASPARPRGRPSPILAFARFGCFGGTGVFR